MMRVNHKTKSSECIIIDQDELYIASSTLQEILHILKNKYKIKIDPNDYQGSDFPNRNMSKSKGWTLQSSLLTLWMEKTRVNNQTKVDDDGNLLKTL